MSIGPGERIGEASDYLNESPVPVPGAKSLFVL